MRIREILFLFWKTQAYLHVKGEVLRQTERLVLEKREGISDENEVSGKCQWVEFKAQAERLVLGRRKDLHPL